MSTPTKPVRIGIIGCGAIAERLHVPDYQVAPEAELVAFGDLDRAKAQALADRFAPGAQVYTDYKKLLAEGLCDAVSVCIPNHLHAPVSIAAAKAGHHVLVEKPMATSAREAQQMIDASKKAGKILLVNQCQRRYAPYRKAREIVQSGVLGQILYVSAMFGHAGPEVWSPSGKWFFNKKEARFGAMADLGVHKADIIRFVTGKEIAEISAFYARLEKTRTDVEDNFAACIKFSDGTLGTLGASWTFKGLGADYLFLHCANGSLRIQVNPEKPVWGHLHNPSGEIVFDLPAPLSEYPESWGMGIGAGFTRAILGLEAPYCTGEEGKKALDIILAAEQSADTGRVVRLKH